MELWNSEIGISVKVIFKMFMWKYRFTRIIQEYEEIKEKALAIPADTKEMISLMKFIEEAQTVKLTKLKENIKVFYFEKKYRKTSVKWFTSNKDLCYWLNIFKNDLSTQGFPENLWDRCSEIYIFIFFQYLFHAINLFNKQ